MTDKKNKKLFCLNTCETGKRYFYLVFIVAPENNLVCVVCLSVCVSQGSLIACEFLLQNAADVNQRDMRGRGPLHHATGLGHTG